MSEFSNNKNIEFAELRKMESYSETLVDQLQNGNYEVLKAVSSNERRDIDFMEPILYAVKNEHGTYKVFKYYGENLQNDLDLVIDIVRKEPELIENTSISSNPEYILELSKNNPKVVQYMSPDLKYNSDFTEKLCNLEDKEVIQYVVKECKMPDVIKENVALAGNIEFMKEAVKQDKGFIKYAADNLKNDYEFIKQISGNDKEIIDYVSEHTEEFGKEGLTGAKDSLVEISTDEAISKFEEEASKIEEELKAEEDNEIKSSTEGEKEEYSNEEDVNEIDSSTEEDNGNNKEKEQVKNDNKKEELIKRQKQLQRHIKFLERIKNGEIDPVRAAKLMDKLCKNLDPESRKEIEQLLKIDKAILEKQKESKEKDKEGNNIEHKEKINEENRESSQVKMTQNDIEKITDNVELSEYNEEVRVTTEGIKTMNKDEQQEEKSEEVIKG